MATALTLSAGSSNRQYRNMCIRVFCVNPSILRLLLQPRQGRLLEQLIEDTASRSCSVKGVPQSGGDQPTFVGTAPAEVLDVFPSPEAAVFGSL